MFDIAINNGLVVDTRAKTSAPGHIGINGGKIAAVSPVPLQAETVVDATGLVVSPGFIDVHGHIDGYDYSGRLAAMQGITTTVGGNCGLSPIATGNFLAGQNSGGFAINQAELVGHSFSLRKAAGLASPYTPATAEQLAHMLALAEAALQQGAAGISFGLDYSPGASLQELRALATLCRRYNRVMPVHTRLFTQTDLNSLYEVLSIAKRTGVRLLLSHFVYQYSGYGMIEPALAIVEKARQNGLDVWMDSGMYTSWATYIGTATFDETSMLDNSLHLGSLVVATGKYTGQQLNWELYHLLREKYPDESVICFAGQPEEAYAALKAPCAMPSTDIGSYRPGEGHPQIAGSFPKYFREMVRENPLLSLEEAVYKATLLPAETYGIPGKGVLAPGFDADLCLFSLAEICDTAAFPGRGKPDSPPIGLPHVLVNGAFAVRNGVFQNSRTGRAIAF